MGDPLPIIGVAIDVKLRRSGVLKMSKSLKRVFKECDPFDEAAKDLLILALALTLEQHAAYATVPHTKEGYTATITSLEAELKSCEGNPTTNGHLQAFGNLIVEFANKALVATITPSSPPANVVNMETTENSNPAQPTAQAQATTEEKEAEIGLSEQERKALEPLKAPTAALNYIPHTLRRQGLIHVYKRLERLNAIAGEQYYAERLFGIKGANCSQSWRRNFSQACNTTCRAYHGRLRHRTSRMSTGTASTRRQKSLMLQENFLSSCADSTST